MIRGRERLLMVHFDPPTNPMLPVPLCECAARVERGALSSVTNWVKHDPGSRTSSMWFMMRKRSGRFNARATPSHRLQQMKRKRSGEIIRPGQHFYSSAKFHHLHGDEWLLKLDFVFINDSQSQLQPSIMLDTGNGCQKRVQWLRDPH